MYGFAEFASEELASTALEFDKMEFFGILLFNVFACLFNLSTQLVYHFNAFRPCDENWSPERAGEPSHDGQLPGFPATLGRISLGGRGVYPREGEVYGGVVFSVFSP